MCIAMLQTMLYVSLEYLLRYKYYLRGQSYKNTGAATPNAHTEIQCLFFSTFWSMVMHKSQSTVWLSMFDYNNFSTHSRIRSHSDTADVIILDKPKACFRWVIIQQDYVIQIERHSLLQCRMMALRPNIHDRKNIWI